MAGSVNTSRRTASPKKPELEFFLPEPDKWTRVPGAVDGLFEKALAGDASSGNYTRILRFDPGTDTSPNGVLQHDFWEEVLIVSGSIIDLRLNETFSSGMYACRAPGMKHGPWRSPEGCVTFEVRYKQKP